MCKLRSWVGLLVLLSGAQLAAASALSPFAEVTQAAAGAAHTCAVLRSGGVQCWGANDAGQLGLGAGSTRTVRTTPVPVPGLTSVRSVATGLSHTCAVLGDRSVRCWGLNYAGQSGNPSLEYGIGDPFPVSGLSGPVAMLALGDLHSCALLESGQVECWGDDVYGQLGDGNPGEVRATAAPVQQLGGTAVAISAGNLHTCAILGSGAVRCWGYNEFGQLGDNSTTTRSLPVAVQGLTAAAQRIAAGGQSTCAIDANSAVYCWGPQYPLLEFEGGSLVARAYPGFGSNAQEIAAGSAHYCVLQSGNLIRCFGENAFGQFGTGPVDGSLGADSAVDLDAGITRVIAGGSHTCARSAAGGLQCWGDNQSGQLGIDSTSRRLTPTQVSGLTSGIIDIGIGNYHACALTSAGAVKCWGSNGAQQVGDGTTQLRLTPADVLGLSAGVRAIDVGSDSSCAITAQRRAKCWGANYSGQLGIGGAPDTAPPTDVQGLGDVDVLAVGVGREHACALLAGGRMKCWGSNAFGQLGDGSTTLRDTAVDVVGLGTGVKAIGVGYLHTCAITANDGMKCWGYNENGQLGDGSTTQRLTPVDVVGLTSGVLAIGPGGLHSCAVVTGGAVKCWGASNFGLLLGDGSEDDRSVPGDVPALRSGVVELGVSLFGSCARLDSGALRCWGDSGVIGDNSSLSRPLPTEGSGLGRGVSAVDTGYGLGGHACAVVDGAARCWGENTFATIGDGTTFGVPTPQTVLTNPAFRRIASLAEANADVPNPVQLDASGRFVLLSSDADDLVAGDSNGSTDVFLFDREQRVAQRVSVDDDGGQISGASRSASMTSDARLVVFVAPDAGVARVRGESTSKAAARRKGSGVSVYLRNMLTGATQLVAPTSSSNPDPQISANGASISFTTTVSDDAIGTVGQDNVFVVTLTTTGSDVTPSAPLCVSCKPNGPDGSAGLAKADGPSSEAVLSADGSWIAFTTQANNGVANQATPCPAAGTEVILRNMLSGATQRVSPPPGTPATQCGSIGSSAPSIDAAGSLLAWQTDQPLDGSDGNGAIDVYSVSVGSNDPQRVSVGADGVDGNGASTQPRVAGDGSQIVFVSAASNLDTASADNNDRADVHAAAPGSTPVRLSLNATGAEANAPSLAPTLNFDGSQVAFLSSASLLTGSSGGATAVLTRDNPSAPAKRSATWWVPSETGWGLTVFDQGNVLAPAWFTYDTDGEPSWFLIAGAFLQSDGSYRGDVFRFTGTPLLQIDGEAARTVTPVGTASLTYVGEDLLRFDYTVDGITQSKSMTRFPFGQRSYTCTASAQTSRAMATNYTDLWSGSAPNAGWGLTLLHIDDLLVASWYTYDSDGEAVFFVVPTNRQSDGSFTGSIFRQRDGTPFSAINGAPASDGNDAVGSARFEFSNGETGQFSYTIGGVSQTRAIGRLVVGSVPHVCRSADLVGD